MSMSSISFLTEQQQDIRSPEFAKVLKGFDPMEVEAYVFQVTQYVEALEKEIERLQGQRDAAESHYAGVVDEAYGQVAARMGEVLLAADQYVEKISREAEEAARRTVTDAGRNGDAIRKEAENEAARIRGEAEAEAARMRESGDQALSDALAEVDRVLGGLVLRRDEMLGELSDVRSKVLDVIARIDVASAAAKARRGTPATPAVRIPEAVSHVEPEPAGPPQLVLPDVVPPETTGHVETGPEMHDIFSERLEPSLANDDDDLLTLPHGFDLVIGGIFDEDDDENPWRGDGLS
jgi:cell division septum initiation protein DivIVA